jgi:hypothetical protein
LASFWAGSGQEERRRERERESYWAASEAGPVWIGPTKRRKGGRERAAGPRPQLGHQRRLDWVERERSKGSFLLFYFLKSN